jgi:CheY-like chemotaxis protein
VAARVLIVEDNEQNMELVSFLLEEAGWVVATATSAEQARRELARDTPDVLLLDMDLRGLDGLSLVAEMRRGAGPRFPIVALTAHAMRGDKERFLAGGCDGYISKPIDTKTFAAEVARHLPRAAGEDPTR